MEQLSGREWGCHICLFEQAIWLVTVTEAWLSWQKCYAFTASTGKVYALSISSTGETFFLQIMLSYAKVIAGYHNYANNIHTQAICLSILYSTPSPPHTLTTYTHSSNAKPRTQWSWRSRVSHKSNTHTPIIHRHTNAQHTRATPPILPHLSLCCLSRSLRHSTHEKSTTVVTTSAPAAAISPSAHHTVVPTVKRRAAAVVQWTIPTEG